MEREFDVEQPNQVFASDITYVWTREGWLYLAVVIDLYSRKIVGWSMGSRMTAQLVCDALTMAVWLRRPKAGLIHHSDRGSQYASKAFRELLKAHGFKGSMSWKGDCWDTQSKLPVNVQPNLTRAGIMIGKVTTFAGDMEPDICVNIKLFNHRSFILIDHTKGFSLRSGASICTLKSIRLIFLSRHQHHFVSDVGLRFYSPAFVL